MTMASLHCNRLGTATCRQHCEAARRRGRRLREQTAGAKHMTLAAGAREGMTTKLCCGQNTTDMPAVQYLTEKYAAGGLHMSGTAV